VTVRIQLRFARPHMHLAEAVVGPDGRVIAGVGTTLGESVVRALLRQGIESAVVEEADEVAEWEEAKDLDAALAALDARFAGEPADAILTTLKASLARHLRTRAARREDEVP
jgi:hypothetical protein